MLTNAVDKLKFEFCLWIDLYKTESHEQELTETEMLCRHACKLQWLSVDLGSFGKFWPKTDGQNCNVTLPVLPFNQTGRRGVSLSWAGETISWMLMIMMGKYSFIYHWSSWPCRDDQICCAAFSSRLTPRDWKTSEVVHSRGQETLTAHCHAAWCLPADTTGRTSLIPIPNRRIRSVSYITTLTTYLDSAC